VKRTIYRWTLDIIGAMCAVGPVVWYYAVAPTRMWVVAVCGLSVVGTSILSRWAAEDEVRRVAEAQEGRES